MSSEKEYMAADLRGPLNVFRSTATGSIASGSSPEPRSSYMNAPSGIAGQIVALLVASGVSQTFDMATGMGQGGGTGAGGFGFSQFQGHFVRMIPESCGDTWYAWTTATGTSIDRTATGVGTGVCAFLPSKTYSDELPAGRFLSIQPTQGGVFRLWITNRVN